MVDKPEIKGGDKSQGFDYSELDATMADFLRHKESNMREIVGKAYTDLGRELKEAQDELRKQGSADGTFMAWYISIGFNSKQVSRLIQRFELLTNCQEPDQAILEDLPVSLTYEIAKPSAESTPAKAQAKSEVLSGNITKLKEYKERIAELEKAKDEAVASRRQAESTAQAERKERERLEKMATKEQEVRTEVRTEYIETVPDDYEKLRQENEEMRSKFGGRFAKVDAEKRNELHTEFANDLDYLREKYASILFDADKVRKLAESDAVVGRSLDKFDDFWNEFSKALFKDETIIEMGR